MTLPKSLHLNLASSTDGQFKPSCNGLECNSLVLVWKSVVLVLPRDDVFTLPFFVLYGGLYSQSLLFLSFSFPLCSVIGV